jgi:hypothetical protein
METPTTQQDDSQQAMMYNCFLAKKLINNQEVILQHFTKFVNIWEINPVINEIKTNIFGSNIRSYQWVKDVSAFNDMPVVKVTLLGNSVIKTEEIKFTPQPSLPKAEFLMSLGKDSTSLKSVFVHALTFDDSKVIKSHARVRKLIEQVIMSKYGKLYPIIMIKDNKNFSQFNHYHVVIDLKNTKNMIQTTDIDVRKTSPDKWVKFSDDEAISTAFIKDTVTQEMANKMWAMVAIEVKELENQSVSAEE